MSRSTPRYRAFPALSSALRTPLASTIERVFSPSALDALQQKRFAQLLSIHSIIVASAFVLLVSSCARHPDASTTGRSTSATLFSVLDQNHDGQISLSEFLAAFKDKDRAAEEFRQTDTNRDGTLSPDEVDGRREKKHHDKLEPIDVELFSW